MKGTMAMNIRKGTMMILHSCLVNYAAALMMAAATFNFLRLQQIARKENPASVQQI
jgi:hypothetical protein